MYFISLCLPSYFPQDFPCFVRVTSSFHSFTAELSIPTLFLKVNPDARRRGTFFDFASVFPRNNAYGSRDIGTTVSGQKGPDDAKTLKDCRFEIGDYIDIAITPNASGNGAYPRMIGSNQRPERGAGGGGQMRRNDRDARRFRPF